MSIPANIQPLFNAALNVRQHAHAPYSSFPVGACIVAEDGKLYVGCNVENASYPQGQCAEATAIGNMVSQGQKSIKALLVVATEDKFPTPCGGCRQRISEFAKANTPIYLCNAQGGFKQLKFGDLLPYQFGSEDLK
jgi:cytidine deaminase